MPVNPSGTPVLSETSGNTSVRLPAAENRAAAARRIVLGRRRILGQQIYRAVGDDRGGRAGDALLIDRVSHHGDIAARRAQLAQIGDMAELVACSIL